MIRFLVLRVLTGILVLWLISMAVFGLFFVAPNNVARTLGGRQATPQTIELINHRLGLDRPIWRQYVSFVNDALHGNLGYDYYHQQPVTTMIREAFPITLSLALGAALIWVLLGVFNGVLSATHPRGFWDRSLTVTSLVFYSMPSFVLGLAALYLLFFKLTIAGYAWFPGGGYAPLSEGVGPWAQHLVLPWLTIALVAAATYTRLTRGSMLDVLGEDYIRTAVAKGLTPRRVTYRHALRSALTPVVTQFGIDLGQLVGGVVITEQIFSLPGLGRTAVVAITQQDLPVIIGIVLVASTAVIVANILVDLAYAALDPRVRLS